MRVKADRLAVEESASEVQRQELRRWPWDREVCCSWVARAQVQAQAQSRKLQVEVVLASVAACLAKASCPARPSVVDRVLAAPWPAFCKPLSALVTDAADSD